MQIISHFPFFLKEPFCPHDTDSLSTVYYLNTDTLRAVQPPIRSVGRPRQKHAKSMTLSSCPAQIPYERKEAQKVNKPKNWKNTPWLAIKFITFIWIGTKSTLLETGPMHRWHRVSLQMWRHLTSCHLLLCGRSLTDSGHLHLQEAGKEQACSGHDSWLSVSFCLQFEKRFLNSVDKSKWD